MNANETYQMLSKGLRDAATADVGITHAKLLIRAADALKRISETRFGWDGDCGVTSIAEDALTEIISSSQKLVAGSQASIKHNTQFASLMGDYGSAFRTYGDTAAAFTKVAKFVDSRAFAVFRESIADDARFVRRLNAAVATNDAESKAALIEFIDNFHAPRAPAARRDGQCSHVDKTA